MSTELLKAVAASNDWWALGPELTLAVGALLLLVLEIFSPKKDLRFVPALAIFTLFMTLITVVANYDKIWDGEELFGGLIRLSASGQIARVFFLVSSLLVCFLGTICLPRARVPKVEFYHIVLVVTAALMLLAQSNHFVMFFVALETVTIGFYIRVSYYRERTLSLEAGLKYLVLGALSSAILLFGIVLLYGALGRVVVDGVVHTGFEFEPGATTVSTSVDEVLHQKRGVCQDFAHLMLACLRGHGLPARYVSGYLLTDPPPGEERLMGVDATHAWVMLWCGPDLGWIGVDPTNGIWMAGDHVIVAIGRDYADIAPVDGLVLGSGAQHMHVSVDVAPLDEMAA